MTDVSRRSFLAATSFVAGGIAVTGLSGAGAMLVRNTLGGSAAAAEPLPMSAIRSSNGVLSATLTVQDVPTKAAGLDIASGLLTYNGLYSGPTLRVSPGDRLRLNVRNRMVEPTNMHFHGLHVSPKGRQDNVFVVIDPMDDFEYDVEIPADQAGGLYWYHPHLHGLVGKQIYGGLAGLIVVEGGAAARPEIAPLRHRLLNLRYLSFTDFATAPQLVNYDSAESSNAVHLVNGQHQPTLAMAPGETQFWQVCNSSTDAYYNLELPGGRLQIVEVDGGEVWESWFPETVLLPPGKRFGILVTAPSTPGLHTLRSVGYNQGPFGQWPAVALAIVEVAGPSDRSVTAPLQMGTAAAFIAQKPVRRRILDMGEGQTDEAPMFWFDDVPYEKITMKDVISVEVNTVEDWVIRNGSMTSMGTTQEAHPYHQHVNDFAVIERGTYDPVTGTVLTRVRTAPRSLADTINIEPGHWVRIRTQFDRFVGRSVYHCHIAFHEDKGMMGIFDILNADGSGVGVDQKLPTHAHSLHGL